MHFLRVDLKLSLSSFIVKLEIQLHRTIVFDPFLSFIVLKLVGKNCHHPIAINHTHLEFVLAHMHSLSRCR